MTLQPAVRSQTALRLQNLDHGDAEFAVTTVDRYLLLVWRRQITVAGARAARAAMERLYEERPLGLLGFITLIEDGCSLSTSGEVREIMSGMLKDHNYALGATAVAYERPGFLSAIVRSVITAINIASCAVFRSDVSNNVVHAVRFTTQALGDSGRESALLAALSSMRSRPVLSA